MYESRTGCFRMLSAASTSAKLCLRFVVLTAARSGEARNAEWDEIDFNACEWKIPATKLLELERTSLVGFLLDMYRWRRSFLHYTLVL